MPSPNINSLEEIHRYHTRRTIAQHRTNKSPFLESHLHKVDAKSNPSQLFPFCNTHIQDTFSCLLLHQHTYPIATPGFVDRPHWTDRTAGGPQVRTTTTSRLIRLTLLNNLLVNINIK